MKRFEVFNPDWGWRAFPGNSPEEVALAAAEYYDMNGDYSLAGGSEAGFTVREIGCHSLSYFQAAAETSIEYRVASIAHGGLDKYEARALEEALQEERSLELAQKGNEQ